MKSRYFLLAMLLTLISGSVRAESQDQPVTPTLPPPPTIEGQIELPKKSPMDRQKSTAQVKAMELMQSQQSGMMCNMMRQMAMKEADSTNKMMMMMMMAQKSCDSSDASKKAADENDKNSKLITQDDVPKMQTLKASSLPLDYGQSKGSDESQNLDAFKVKLDENYAITDDGTTTANTATDLVNALTAGANDSNNQVISAKDLADAAKDPSGSGGGPSGGGKGGTGGTSMSALPGIPNDGKSPSGANDGAGGGGGGRGGMQAFGGMGGAGSSGAAGSATPAAGAADARGEGAVASGRGKNREVDAGGAGGGGGESAAPAKGGSDAFDALLAQMMGGPPAAGEENGFNAGETAIMAEQASKSQPTTNIFEYAALRYKRLASTNRVLAQSRAQKDAKPVVGTKIAANDAPAASRAPASAPAAVVAQEPKRATLH